MTELKAIFKAFKIQKSDFCKSSNINRTTLFKREKIEKINNKTIKLLVRYIEERIKKDSRLIEYLKSLQINNLK